MKTQKFTSLGFAVLLSVPENVTEFDANAKKEGACLSEAIANVIYRGSLADFREKFAEAVEEATSVERQTKTVMIEVEENGVKIKKPKMAKNDAGVEEPVVVYDESEADYLKRVEASGVSKADLQKIANSVAATIAFDASERERKAPQPKQLAAKFVDAAKQLLAAFADSRKLEEFNKRLHKALAKTFVPTGDAAKDQQALGQLVKDYTAWNESQALAKLVS